MLEANQAGSYLINREAAKKLLSKAYPLKMPINYYLARDWEFDIAFRGVENPRIVYPYLDSFNPNIVISPEKKPDLILKIKRKIYFFQTTLIRIIHNMVYIVNSCFI
jgi:hypothetical protein